jgi:hypothetical protein
MKRIAIGLLIAGVAAIIFGIARWSSVRASATYYTEDDPIGYIALQNMFVPAFIGAVAISFSVYFFGRAKQKR